LGWEYFMDFWRYFVIWFMRAIHIPSVKQNRTNS
jgi:hypothetical protein